MGSLLSSRIWRFSTASLDWMGLRGGNGWRGRGEVAEVGPPERAEGAGWPRMEMEQHSAGPDSRPLALSELIHTSVLNL